MMRPSSNEQATTLLPTNIEMRVPQMRRERMSRPSSSVPLRCCAEGGCRRLGRSMWAGSGGCPRQRNSLAGGSGEPLQQMAHRIVWSKRAADDLDAITGYIAGDSPAYAGVVLKNIVNQTRILAHFPR